MLAKSVTMKLSQKDFPKVAIFYRNSASKSLIPNYEGQPMIDTLRAQVYAAGGTILNDPSDKQLRRTQDDPRLNQSDIIALVNNFSEQQQIEVPHAFSGIKRQQ